MSKVVRVRCIVCKGSGVGKIVEYIDKNGNHQRDVYPCGTCGGTGKTYEIVKD